MTTTMLTGLLLLLSACGDGEGNDDTVLTGLSGFLLVLVVGYILWRVLAKNRK